MKLQLIVLPVANTFVQITQTTVILNVPSFLNLQVKASGLGHGCIQHVVIIQFQEL